MCDESNLFSYTSRSSNGNGNHHLHYTSSPTAASSAAQFVDPLRPNAHAHNAMNPIKAEASTAWTGPLLMNGNNHQQHQQQHLNNHFTGNISGNISGHSATSNNAPSVGMTSPTMQVPRPGTCDDAARDERTSRIRDTNNDHDHPVSLNDNALLLWRQFVQKTRIVLQSMPSSWSELNRVRWMNERASPKTAYVPTDIEHIANVTTHAIWVVPAFFALLVLLWRSETSAQLLVALVYGVSLALLFLVSTVFHCVFYCNRNRPLKDILHRCDRAMIYIFIAGSYYPWLTLSMPIDSQALLFVVKWSTWLLAVFGILYQQMYHERYKCLETFLYIVMGVGPSLVIIGFGHEFSGMAELQTGGLVYLAGILFFKADGTIPFAHAIWHVFVVAASTMHYLAILNYLFAGDAAGSPASGTVAAAASLGTID